MTFLCRFCSTGVCSDYTLNVYYMDFCSSTYGENRGIFCLVKMSPPHVVYFDQRLGAAHSKCWSKYTTPTHVTVELLLGIVEIYSSETKTT